MPEWQIAFLVALAVSYSYFTLAGSSVFVQADEDGDTLGALLATICFLVGGSFGTLLLGRTVEVAPLSAIIAALLMLGALVLYEWARRTIRGRHFHLAWSGQVPLEICTEGPYRYIRHPVYLSYVIALLAMPVALQRWEALAVFGFTSVVFLHAAFDDEKSLAASELGTEYANYRRRVGMFAPRLLPKRKVP